MPERLERESALTLGEVATILHCSTRTVRREIDAGRLKSFKVGRARRIFASDLRDYIDIHRLTQGSEVTANPALLCSSEMLETVCTLLCGSRTEGEATGVAMYFLTTFHLSHSCRHLRELVGKSEEQLFGDGWMTVTDGRSLEPVRSEREAGVRHLVMDYPLEQQYGSVLFDALVGPIFDVQGNITNTLVALCQSESPWRDQIDPARQFRLDRSLDENFSEMTQRDSE